MDNSCKHPVWKATAVWLTPVETLFDEGNNKSTLWAELHAVFLGEME